MPGPDDEEAPDQPVDASPDPVPGTEPAAGHDDAGLDLARAVARGLAGRTGPARRTPRADRARARTDRSTERSGAHPDERDPQPLERTLGRFVEDRGWSTELRVHQVFVRWESIVGAEVGRHVRPESFADGRLVVRTDSTAWATQMKLLAADLVRRLNEVLGHGTVEVIDVHGPHAPSWSRGRLRVRGRGPRDTYG